jgi:hypothetical protein
MVGEKQIVAVRRRGKKPRAIFIEVGFENRAAERFFSGGEGIHTDPVGKNAGRPVLVNGSHIPDPEKMLENGCYPVVTDVKPSDDFRFCIGCRVHVHGAAWTDEVIDIAEKIAEAGAEKVVVCCINDTRELMVFDQGEWRAYADPH